MIKTILITVGCVIAALFLYEFVIKKALKLNSYEEYSSYERA